MTEWWARVGKRQFESPLGLVFERRNILILCLDLRFVNRVELMRKSKGRSNPLIQIIGVGQIELIL
jgi:hypothetical protein